MLAHLVGACGDDAEEEVVQQPDGGAPRDAAPSEVGEVIDASRFDAAIDSSIPDSATGPSADAQSGDAAVVGREGFLLVAELAAGKESIHAYSLPELQHTGQIDDVKLGSHLGAIALEDGRVITSDDKHDQLIAIRFDAAGKPSIVNRVDANLGTGAVWGCGDKDLRYFAVSSGHDGVEQVANVLKLDDFTLRELPITVPSVNGASEEVHAAVAGDPAHLFASVGGEIRVWPLADVLAGTAAGPVATIPINTGSHGIVVSHRTGVLYITSGAGFDGAALQMPFARTQLVPWDVDGLSTGRNARPRLSYDGRFIYGAIAQTVPEGAERWAERPVDLHITDLDAKTAKRSALTKGVVPKFQLSQKLALFANVDETGASQAILVDVVSGSPTFQQVVARVPLARLTNGPVVGQSTSGKQALGSAITPDGKWAFVSHGGDGKISVIETASRTVARVIETPTTLANGGYLFAVQPGVEPVDTCAR
ncbi:MAG TPA: hypothetical protein VFX59_29410 [Polyangiales bacterium]|nr:hypothetical protein [Polyangiales bacterium]